MKIMKYKFFAATPIWRTHIWLQKYAQLPKIDTNNEKKGQKFASSFLPFYFGKTMGKLLKSINSSFSR